MDDLSKSHETGFTLFARVSPDDVVLYANTALARYLGWSKSDLIGQSLEKVADALTGEMAEFFSRQAVTGSFNRFLADDQGRVFEASQVSDGVVLDLMLTEVTHADRLLAPYRSSIALGQDELTEEEIRGVMQPERRIVTLTRSRLCGLSGLAASLSPTEVRLILETFSEEMRESILENASSVGDMRADEVEGIHGVPRYYQDHALRALRCAFLQQERMQEVRGELHRVGKEIPGIAAAVAGGEVLLAPLAVPGRSRLTATGAASDLCQRLVRLSRPGEILVSQFALTGILSHLPEGWTFIRAESEEPPDLSDLTWNGEEILPLPDELQRKVYLVGPQVEDHPEQCQFYFDYLYSLRCPGFDTPVPVLRAVRPETGGNISLSDEKMVVTQTAQVLGKYKLLEIVGTGGMGKVWRAQDRFGNTVAIKVLNSQEAANEETVRRFQREANVMARLPHRNICRVFEIGSFEGILFIAMEYVNGPTLADLLYQGLNDSSVASPTKGQLQELIKSLQVSRNEAVQRGEQPVAETAARPLTNRILPTAQTLSLFLKICAGVQFAHDQGILHRDLKPGNVLLREDGEPVVADFGLAKLEEEAEVSLSVSGHIVGTIENMSPEQAQSSKDVDERADVYSLGTILYQMLTGHRYFQASGNLVQDAQRLANYSPIRPRQLNPQIDPDLEIICLKSLRPNPSERYRTVSALIEDIQRFRRGEIIKARSVTAIELFGKLLARNKAVTATVFIAVLALSTLAVFSFWQMNNRRLAAEQALAHRDRADDAVRREMAMREQYQEQIARLEDKLRQGATPATASRTPPEETNPSPPQTATPVSEPPAKETSSAPLEIVQTPNQVEPSNEPPTSPSPPSEPTISPEDQLQALVSLDRARAIFLYSFPLENLLNPDYADEHYEIALEGLSESSLALALMGNLPEAQLLKGYFHLVFNEYAEANAAWEAAAQVSDEEFPLAFQARLLREQARETFSERGENRRDFLNRLASSDILDFVKVAYLSDQLTPISRMGRITTPGEERLEAALHPPPAETIAEPVAEVVSDTGSNRTSSTEVASDPQDVPVEESVPLGNRVVRDARGGRALEIYDSSTLADVPEMLTAANGPVSRLRLLKVSEIDWTELEPHGFTAMEVEAGSAGLFPDSPLAIFDKITELSIRQTPLTSLGFLGNANQLRSLEILGSDVEDFSPITMCPLDVLVIDTEVAADSRVTRLLGFHRSLRKLRTPADPPGQTVDQFFQRQQRGIYERTTR